MNQFKVAMTKKSNASIVDRDLYAIETNQKQVKPIQDKLLTQIYKIHYTTLRRLKMFTSTSWYTMRFRLVKPAAYGSIVLFVGDDVETLAKDAYPMLMRIKDENNAIKDKVLKEYPLATWLSNEAQSNIRKLAIESMGLDVIQIISQDRCHLYYKSPLHGNERLKVQYYYRTRKLIFDVEA